MKAYSLDNIRDLIEECLDMPGTGDPFVDERYREQIELVGHVQPYYRLFWLIASKLQPGLTVELGSWQATAAAHFASGWSHGVVVTMDHHSDPGDDEHRSRAIEAAMHYPNLIYLQSWTWDAVDTVRTQGRPIDILFIDSWHEYERVMRDWNDYRPLLTDGALVIADDIFEDKTGATIVGMQRFWSELESEKFLDDRIHPGIPMGFFIWRCKEAASPAREAAYGKAKER